MEQKNEIVKTSGNLQIGERKEVKEIADRLRTMTPNATKFTEGEALAVAQVAAMNGLDPFNGEVWGIKGKDGEWKGVMVGVKGLRKSGRRQADKENGTYWTDFIQVDPATHGATKPGSVVWECHLRDTVTTQAWAKSVNMLTTSGATYAEAKAMLGKSPVSIGVGIADPGEFSKMGLTQRAKKRAEADALKQRYNVSFGPGVVSEGDKFDEATAKAAEESEASLPGYIDGGPDLEKLEAIEGQTTEIPAAASAEIDPEYAAYIDAGEALTPSGKKLSEVADSMLEMAAKSTKHPETAAAAQIRLDYKAKLAAKESKSLEDLGY